MFLLYAAAGLAAVFILLLVLFLLSKVKLDFQKQEDKITVTLTVMHLTLALYPLKKKKRASARKHEKVDTIKQEESTSKAQKQPDVNQMIDLALQMLTEFKNAITIECLETEVLIASKDAARTGILLGQCSAAAGILYPWLERNYKINRAKIKLDADFEATKIRWNAHLIIWARPVWVLRTFKLFWKPMMERYKEYGEIEKDEERAAI